MKYMFPTICAVAGEFKKLIDNQLSNNMHEMEMKEILARFTTDVIGTCAFGIECNSLSDPNAIFREMGKNIFVPTKYLRPKMMFAMNFPFLAKRLGISLGRADVMEFFLGAVRDTVAYRENHDVKRNDFMDLLIALKNSPDGLTMNEISAQAFVFFLAGFETSSTTMSFAMHELATHPDIQEKARAEVQAIMKKYDGKLTFEGIMEMKYLEQCVNGKQKLRNINQVTVNLILKIVFF